MSRSVLPENLPSDRERHNSEECRFSLEELAAEITVFC